jgi:hypothetical protein
MRGKGRSKHRQQKYLREEREGWMDRINGHNGAL